MQQRRILEAAWRLLARCGLEDIRVEDVLQEAEVSRQTFYRCYPNLEALFKAVHEEVDGYLQEAVRNALAAAEAPGEWFFALIDAVVDAARAAGPTLIAIEREELRPGSSLFGARTRRQAALAETIAAWYRQQHGVHAGVWRIRAVLMALNQLCLAVCDPLRSSDADVAAAKDAARAIAHGLLLLEEQERHRSDLTPRESKRQGDAP